MTAALTRPDLAALAEQTARNLARAGLLDGRAFIRTPILFPSGATAVVVIEEEGGGRLRLTDLGQGREEAELQGIGPTYRRQVQEVARRSGLAVEGGALVLAGVTAAQVVAGVITVANAAARALEWASLRAVHRPEAADVEKLVGRLGALFPRAELVRETEMRGASTHPWPVAAVLRTERGQAVFDLVRPSAVSVAFAAAKFHDLARLEQPPARIAVVQRKAGLGDLLSVVAQAARVVEQDAGDQRVPAGGDGGVAGGAALTRRAARGRPLPRSGRGGVGGRFPGLPGCVRRRLRGGAGSRGSRTGARASPGSRARRCGARRARNGRRAGRRRLR